MHGCIDTPNMFADACAYIALEYARISSICHWHLFNLFIYWFISWFINLLIWNRMLYVFLNGAVFPKGPAPFSDSSHGHQRIQVWLHGMVSKHGNDYQTWTIIYIYYQVVPGTRRGGSFKNRTWLWEPVCLWEMFLELERILSELKRLNWMEMNWVELSWIELNWIELNWVKNWIEWVSERMSEAMNEWNDMK